MQAISDTISSLHLGEAETFEGLTIIPLLGESQSEPDYITLDEALEQKTVRVLEVSQSGDVPNLLFDNQGDSKVLLVDGDSWSAPSEPHYQPHHPRGGPQPGRDSGLLRGGRPLGLPQPGVRVPETQHVF